MEQQSKKKFIKKDHKNKSTQNVSEKKKQSVLKVKGKETVKSNDQSIPIVGKPWSQIQVQLRQEIVESLHRNNFNTMFPVQQAGIPLLLKNYDLAVEAQTGSGKTLAFLVPLLQKYLAFKDPSKTSQDDENTHQNTKVKYLLISPTRQLCQQSYSTLVKLLDKLPDSQRSEGYKQFCHCVTGGSQLEEDLAKIKQGVIVLIGTVGRIRQISQKMEQNWLKKVDYLFIDEADRVLKEKGIEEVIRSIQKLRRTAMFSATLQGLQQKNFQFFGMRNLAKITLKAIDSSSSKTSKTDKIPQGIKGYVVPKSLTNTYLVMKDRLQKMQFLINFLQQKMHTSKIIVFLSTCASVDFYTKMMNLYFKEKQQICGIHGKLKTNRRQRIIKTFLEKTNGVLFATDVVSRGIDFQHVHFIVQADPPEDPDNYIHRIGRTARVNRPGTAILLIQEHQQAFINYLSDKGVGVKRVQKNHFSKGQTEIGLISERMFQIIASDRDNVEKSKKAFVSYIRAYKQHDLRYIFQFKNIDIGQIANSFFLFRIPRVKEILGRNFSTFHQQDIDLQTIPWLDKNQKSQFRAKEEHRSQMRQERQQLAKPVENIKNIKSKRKKVRRKNQQKERNILNKEHKQILKAKRDKSKHIQANISQDQNEDTQQIEQRIANRHQQI